MAKPKRRLFRKAILVVLLLIAAVQIPFIYRRFVTSNRAAVIADLGSKRIERPASKYREYRGIIHAHTSLGGHSTGGFDELIAAANGANLDFVLMTEHWSGDYDTSSLTLNGVFGKTLFVGGNEVDTADADRFLMLPGSKDAAGFRLGKTDAFLSQIHAENRLAMITYPEKFKSWSSDFDGIEVLSLNTAAKQMNPFVAFFDLIWTGSKYPGLMIAQSIRRPTENVRQFDEAAKRRRIGLFFGTDAHSNIGLHLIGDDAGHKILNLKLDPYQTAFGIVQLHVLLDGGTPLTRESLIDALRSGHYFASLNALGDAAGFRFEALDGPDPKPAGDEVRFSEQLMLNVLAPVHIRGVVYKNGEKIAEEKNATEFTFKPDGPGVYRVEAYLDQLGLDADGMPWIMSNPIYVR